MTKNPPNQTKNQTSKGSTLFLQRVNYLVVAHLDRPNFGNTQLAQEIQISESQLFRRIKSLTLQSTAIHIRSIRLKVAKELLINSKMNISEIAYLSGFKDPSYFTRTFLKEFGKTPSGIRK